MSDSPNPSVLPLFVHTWTLWGVGNDMRIRGSSAAPTALTWVANLAVFMPVTIPWPYPVKRAYWVNGSTVASGTCDFGIYTVSGNRIYSTGNTAQSGANAPQYTTVATPFLLDPGEYYFAWVCDATTSHAFGVAMGASGVGALSGIRSQALGSAVLPASATFATAGITGGPVVCGITRTASGF